MPGAAAHLGLAGQDVQRLSILRRPIQQQLPGRLKLCYLLCLPRPLQMVWARALQGCKSAAKTGWRWNVCDAINTCSHLSCLTTHRDVAVGHVYMQQQSATAVQEHQVLVPHLRLQA